MVPANGKLHISDSEEFTYNLATNPKAGVHVGWLLGLADLSKTILPKIYWLNQVKGIKNFIIMGHSQGAAIACLLRSYLGDLQSKQLLGNDITFKTYCSAAPKTGNLYYAYDFDFITRNGWAFTVVNAADWVPETLFSVQTLTDFNPVNPFTNVGGVIKKQHLITRWFIKYKYNRLKNGVRHAQKRFERNLGGMVFRFVHKILPQLKEPQYVHDNNYQRAGVPIVLQPDEEYYKLYPDTGSNIFVHHMFAPYYLLAKRYY